MNSIKNPIIVISVILLLNSFMTPVDFLSEHKKFERVQTAFDEKETIIQKQLSEHDLQSNDFHMLMVAYKEEDELEIYVRRKTELTYKKLIQYDVCAKSGQLGPKRKQGDLQVPEGFYYIDRFNPVSNFYLSLGLNYPNESDRKKSTAKQLGGDIFIHGSCVTIGCLPMTDDKIKEIYLYAVHARNNGQDKIPVYIFPFKMTDENFSSYINMTAYKDNTALVDFWKNIKAGYDKFHKNKTELRTAIDGDGNYIYL